MKMILEKIGNQIQRQFVKDDNDLFWQALVSLDPELLPRDDLARVDYGQVLLRLKTEEKPEVFCQFQQVPWYFAEVGKHVFESDDPFVLQIKACEQFYFIQLTTEAGGLIDVPFFHRFTPDDTDKNDDRRTEDVQRGPADLLLFLSRALAPVAAMQDNRVRCPEEIKKDVLEVLRWFDLEFLITPVSNPDNSDKREVQVEPKIKWPSPDNKWKSHDDPHKYFITYTEPTKDDGHGERILVVSSNVREALSQIAAVWHNPSAASVLISAWTGSGKDSLQKLFMHGMSQEDPPEFSAPSMKSAEEEIGDALVKRANKIKLKLWRPTVVFIDEIHHPSAQEVRENLLRFMESGKYECKKLRKTFRFKKDLMYLFAASKSPEELRQLAPVDFWTRIDHMIKMSHPLALKSQDDRLLVLRQYFGMFWHATLKNAKPKKSKDEFTIHDLLEEPKCVAEVGSKFTKLFDSPFIPIISIRMIRSIVQRIASLAIYEIKTQDIAIAAPLIKDADPMQVGKIISERVDDWTKNLFAEIVPSLQPKGAF